jgi:hypothetical protein
LVQDLVRHGRGPEALKIASKLKSYNRAGAFDAIAQAHYRQNEITLGDAALRLAIKASAESNLQFGMPFTARNFGRTELLREVIELYLRCATQPEQFVHAFRFAGWADDPALFKRCETAAHQSLQKAKAKEPVGNPEYHLRQLAEHHVVVAAGYANAGKLQEMNEWIARAEAIHKPEDYSSTEGLPYIIQDFARRGDDATADAMAKKYYKSADDSWLYLCESVAGHLHRNEFVKAFEQASRLEPKQADRKAQFQAHAIYGLRASGDVVGEGAMFKKIPEPRSRAIVALTVADLIARRPLGEQALGRVDLD